MSVPSHPINYHVQSTAKILRNGFPYFPYHDSISALWSDRWRKPCAAGIYPFTDGDVNDFDPIFSELVESFEDDPGILDRPDDYARSFLPVGRRLFEEGQAALLEGRDDDARNRLLRAAAVYRIARFPIVRSPLTEEAWSKGKAAYEQGGLLLDPPSVAISIPFKHAQSSKGDKVGSIPAYLRTPTGERPATGWPVLLFICGLDAYRTDNTPRTQQHVDSGFAVLSFEIPGTGDCPASPTDPSSPDRLMSSVLDWVEASADEQGFDVNRILARGISTGGYYAMRIAHTHSERMFAVAAQGGGCHHMFDSAWIMAQSQMEYPFALAEALAYKFGFRDSDHTKALGRYAAEARKFSLLDAGILQKPTCRLLVLNGMEDSIFPIEDSFIVASRGRNKDLLLRGNLSHMGNPGGEEIVLQWLSQAIADK